MCFHDSLVYDFFHLLYPGFSVSARIIAAKAIMQTESIVNEFLKIPPPHKWQD
jgi:hypothetical protein